MKKAKTKTFRVAKKWNYDRPPYFAPPSHVRYPLGCRLCDPTGTDIHAKPTPDCKCQGAFAWVDGKDFVILVAPPGWGKSYFMRRDAKRRSDEDSDLKFGISIPKLAIARGSLSGELNCDLGLLPKLDPAHDLSGGQIDEGDGVKKSKVGRIRAWLLAPASPSPAGRTMLASNVAWAAVFDPSDPGAPRPAVMRDIHMYYDEGHHLAQPWFDGDEGSTDLGDVERDALDVGCVGATIASATPFRRDRRSLNHTEHEDKFKTFFCPLDLYMKNILRRLKNLSFKSIVLEDWRDMKGQVTSLLKTVADAKQAGRRRPAIVFTARSDYPASKAVPAHWVAREARRFGLNVKLFVEDRVGGRKRRQRAVREWVAMSDAEMRAIDVVVTCRVFDEGVDFPYAELAIDLSPYKFIGGIIQRLGRIIRDEKEECEYVNIYGPVTTADPRTCELVMDRENAALAGTLTIDALIIGPVGPRESPNPAVMALRDPDTLAEFDEVAVRLLRSDSEPEFINQVLADWLSVKSGASEADCFAAVIARVRHIVMGVHGSGCGGATRNPPHPMLAAGHSLDLEALRADGVAIIILAKGVFATEFPMTASDMTKLREAVERQFGRPLEDDEIVQCAEAFKKEHNGECPQQRSGADCLPYGLRWSTIDQRLRKERGYGLHDFLVSKGLLKVKEMFSLEMVERCAREHVVKHGEPPSAFDCESDCLPSGWRWSAIDQRLRKERGYGLYDFLIRKGFLNVKEPFSLEMVERCARDYKVKHKKNPSQGSGSDCLPDGWKWSTINERLKAEYGGLPGFLRTKKMKKELFSEAMVMRCAGEYKKKHDGKPPSGTSGGKSGSDCLPDGWTWYQISRIWPSTRRRAPCRGRRARAPPRAGRRRGHVSSCFVAHTTETVVCVSFFGRTARASA